MYKHTLTFIVFAVMSLALANPMQPDTADQRPVNNRQSAVYVSPRYPVLQAIIIVGDLKKAIFKGPQEILEGEKIAGFIVSSITPDSVTLTRGDNKKTLYLKSPGEFKLSPVNED